MVFRRSTLIFFSNALPKGGIYYLSFLSEYADSSLKNHGHLAIPALNLDSSFDGDYTLTAGSKEYYFDNIQFVSPIKNLTNLVLALPFLQTDSSGKAIGITWTWVEYTGTGYDILTREELSIAMANLPRVQIDLEDRRWYLGMDTTSYEVLGDEAQETTEIDYIDYMIMK